MSLSLLPFVVPRLDLAAGWIEGVVVAVYVGAQALIIVYSCHRYVTLWRWWRGRGARERSAPAPPEQWPWVTVQLPIYNERRVVDRLIDAVAALDYPADRLEIQVLDDSTDETSGRAIAAAVRHQAHGVGIRVLRRCHRRGYKAGALSAGLGRARGELIVVFDADFLPGRDFLKRVVPHFSDPRVGMVQARWGHLNRDRSLLTAAQAVMLDSHFLLEHAVRMDTGLFFNFNGTAGAWRRSCIDSSGGWMHDTLTEDLDLSYRAQLLGWRFVFDPTIESPAELPGDMEALKSQQRRWAKGSIQTARKLLPRVFASRLSRRVKLEAFFHLTSNLAYPLLLALGLLLLPVTLVTSQAPARLASLLELAVIVLGIVPVSMFLCAGQIALGASAWRVLRDVGAALMLGAGLSVNNTRAVLEGLGSRLGEWERTPKSGDGSSPPGISPYRSARAGAGRIELLLAVYFAGVAMLAWSQGRHRSLPFVLLLLCGLGYVGFGSIKARLAAHRS